MTDTNTMSEMPLLTRRLDTTSGAARARMNARNRSERRFRAYGLSAILLAGMLLLIILGDILFKAAPAFTQSYLNIDVAVTSKHVDPKALASGDYQGAVREALRAQFPEIKSKSERKALDAVLSVGAGDELRRLIAADPSVIGSTIHLPLLVSSDADLYLKGATTGRIVMAGTGEATPSGVSEQISVQSTPGAFNPALAEIRVLMERNAKDFEFELKMLLPSLQTADANLAAAQKMVEAASAAGDANAVKRAEAEVASATAGRAALDSKISSLKTIIEANQKRLQDKESAIAFDSLMPSLLISINDGVVKVSGLAQDRIEGDVIVPLTSAAPAAPGKWSSIFLENPESSRKLQDRTIGFLEKLRETGAIKSKFNTGFFVNGDSREPEQAGILGALVGSAYTMLVTLILCLPIGVCAAVYLEEFAPKGRLTDIVEVNINNLASVPSIVFGLLGLAVFLNVFGLPRSSPIAGGLVLALLVLPTIIIASRAALKAVPPSIREAAIGVGASKQQAIFHHVLPLALPGILTGTIIGMAHALGETAPLLMIGMVAFIVDVPGSITEAATVLPVQIFLWSDLPEVGFQAKTAAAIVVLLLFLIVMNGLAILLRNKFERRW